MQEEHELSLARRLFRYLASTGGHLKGSLGFGNDGDIFATYEGTAIKLFNREEDFRQELSVYQRLAEMAVVDILGHNVPQVIHWDEGLLIMEISIVKRPFLLDFASALLDWGPDFSEEVLEEW